MRAIILAAVLALSGLAPGVAMAQSREQVEQRQAQILQNWLGDMAGWSTGYQALYLEQIEVLTQMLGAATTALEYYDSGDHRGGAAWAQTWSEQTRASLHAPVVAVRALDRPPPPMSADVAALSPELAQLRDQMAGLPSIYVDLFESTESELGHLVTAIAATAGGDDEAARALPAKILLVGIAQLRGEIVLSEASLPMMRISGGIQEHLVLSGIAANHAGIAVLRYEQRLLEGLPADATATAYEIERQAAAMNAAMDTFEANGASARATISAMPDSTAELRGRLLQVIASVPESARVERQIARHLEEMARLLRSPQAADLERLLALWDPIDPLFQRRIELDAQRRAILAAG